MRKPWIKWLLVTVLVAVPAFLLSPILYEGHGHPLILRHSKR